MYVKDKKNKISDFVYVGRICNLAVAGLVFFPKQNKADGKR